MVRSKTKSTKKTKRKTPVKPYTAKFSPGHVSSRALKVFNFVRDNGPVTIQEIGNDVFKRERPAAKRNSWVRNQLRVLRGWKVLKHWPRKGTAEPAKYSTIATLPMEALEEKA